MSDYSTEHGILVPAAQTSTPTLSSDHDPPLQVLYTGSPVQGPGWEKLLGLFCVRRMQLPSWSWIAHDSWEQMETLPSQCSPL